MSLCAEVRGKVRGRRTTDQGLEVVLQLPRTGPLRPGERLSCQQGRLGRRAADETIGRGCWRSCPELWRGQRLLPGDPMALNGASRQRLHGLAGQPVAGMLNWAGGLRPDAAALDPCRQARAGLSGQMEAGVIHDDGGDLLCCRYRGDSTQAARCWFVRIWALLHQWRGQSPPVLPRVWPLQDALLPLGASRAWSALRSSQYSSNSIFFFQIFKISTKLVFHSLCINSSNSSLILTLNELF